ncbi:MAG TPA: hypothetical protein VKZ41_08080 [Gemmatimonadales bacterium]|nr:hypothetical protein [Gemmatimonadales bacterium]
MSTWTEKDQRMFERLRDGQVPRSAESDLSDSKRRTLKSKALLRNQATALDEVVRKGATGRRGGARKR